MTAQAILFFAAGFETTASALSFCLYEISVNPHVQVKMRKEIDEILTKHNGKTNYQALKDMVYMEAVINGKFPFIHYQSIVKNSSKLVSCLTRQTGFID